MQLDTGFMSAKYLSCRFLRTVLGEERKVVPAAEAWFVGAGWVWTLVSGKEAYYTFRGVGAIPSFL